MEIKSKNQKKLTVDQILNSLKIINRERDVISLKYSNEMLNERDWIKKLKSEGYNV